MGFPTISLRPTTTASFPSSSISYSARESHDPERGRRHEHRLAEEQRRPAFNGWNPSTSFVASTASVTRLVHVLGQR